MEDFIKTKHGKIIWILNPHVHEGNLKNSNLTNSIIDRFRDITYNIFKSVDPDKIIIWSSLARHVDETLYMMSDGFHIPRIVLEQSIYVRYLIFFMLFFQNSNKFPIKSFLQMLLNLHCNDNMNFNDGSCCKSYDVPSGLQKCAFYGFLSW